MSKALFWDFDGTLVHPNQSFFHAFQAASPWYHYGISYPDKTGKLWWESFFEKLDIFFAEHNIASRDASKIKKHA